MQAWSIMHAAVLSAIAIATGAAVWVGRRLRQTRPRQHHAMLLGWVLFVLVWQVFTQLWWAWPSNFILESSLPLHVCDLVAWTIPFALLWQRRWAQSLLYFCGVGLSIWAFFVPTATEGPDQIEFWLYWLGHTQIVGSGIYLVAVLNYLPDGKDLLVTSAALLLYTAIVLPIDVAFGLDYGYVGPVSNVVGWLGPWPARVGMLLLLEVAAFVVLWAAAAALNGRRSMGGGRQPITPAAER